MPVSQSLRDRLAEGCRDLVVRFELSTSSSAGAVSFDRLALGYHVPVVASPFCGAPPLSPDAEDELPNGYLRRHTWRSGAYVQIELARLQEALEGDPQILGITADDAAQHFIALVDRGATQDLSTVAERLELLQPTIPLVVRPSCRSGGELRRALEVIQRGEFHPRAAEVELLYSLDVAKGRDDVLADRAGADVARTLQTELGPLVRIEYRQVPVEPARRTSDPVRSPELDAAWARPSGI
ncbi:hypothetical protein [Sorangium cellulosum]|uniref:hypothetical protein n=1 Tax=Sorangium cellulosum TaxID=56 RepID=UPI000322BD29|nr:hypothetical protein [Sorangium cellulosum]